MHLRMKYAHDISGQCDLYLFANGLVIVLRFYEYVRELYWFGRKLHSILIPLSETEFI